MLSEADILGPLSKIRHNELPVVIKKYERWFSCLEGSHPDVYPRAAAQTKHIYHGPEQVNLRNPESEMI